MGPSPRGLGHPGRNTWTRCGCVCVFLQTHIGHHLDLLVLGFVEDAGVLQHFRQRRAVLHLLVQAVDKLLQLGTGLLELLGEFLPSGFVWKAEKGAFWANPIADIKPQGRK